MNVMLLAAGEGTRLRPFTNILPKPAMPFLTVPLAAHALGFLRELEINKLVVNTYHLPQKIHELFHSLPHGARELHFSDEKEEILGSGGGLGNARKHFVSGGDFIMMNADEVILPKDSGVLQKAVAAHKASGALATLMTINHPGVGTQFGGVWANQNNQVQGFGKSSFPGSAQAWHFVGVQILSERIFDYITPKGASNILYDALTAGIAAGDVVQVFPFECSWFETGNFKDFLEASKECIRYLSQNEFTFQKSSLQATLNRFASNPLKVASDDTVLRAVSANAKIDTSADIQGVLVVGSGGSVGAGCRLHNVIVANGVAIPANTDASDTFLLGD